MAYQIHQRIRARRIAIVRKAISCGSRKFQSGGIRVVRQISASSEAMFAVIHLLATSITDLFKSRRQLEVENLFLRHQLNVVWRKTAIRTSEA
jgi:hypothetical protein